MYISDFAGDGYEYRPTFRISERFYFITSLSDPQQGSADTLCCPLGNRSLLLKKILTFRLIFFLDK